MVGSASVQPSRDWLCGFQEHLRAQGASYRTRAAYSADLRDFLRHADASLLKVTAAELERYVSTQARGGIRRATLLRRLAGLRRFFDYLVASGARCDNPAHALAIEPVSGPGLSEKQILSIFRFLRLRSRQVPPRRAMAEELAVMMMLFCGVRQSHFSRLASSSFQPSNGSLRLKVGPAEELEIDGPVLGHLGAYLRRYPREPKAFPVSGRGVRRLLGEIAAGLDIELDFRRIRTTGRWLSSHPERACQLLSRIEDIHE